MIKILFVSVIHSTSEVEGRYPDLGLGYLAAVLQQRFPTEVDIRICNKDFDKIFKEDRPDLVGLRAVSQNYGLAQKIARQVHQAGIPVLMGGIHITSLPEVLDTHMTLGCLGEGEETIIELIRLYLDQGRFAPTELAKINGLCFWEDNRIVLSSPRPVIADLDSIPIPARNLLNIDKHTYIFSSRGCPYRCRFCASSAYWKKLRFFSADYVINEIGVLVEEYKVNFITFYDDMFISNVNRLRDIAERLTRSNLLAKVKFSCSCSAPNITDEVAYILKEMNVVSVALGLESGCEKTLKYLKGESYSVAKNWRAVEILRKHHISTNAGFVIGSPQETAADMMETYRFIQQIPSILIDIYVLTPYPGTAIWDYALSKQLVSNDMDWERLNVNFEVNHENAIILSETLSRKEIYSLYQKFRRLRFWRNLQNIWRHPFLADLPKVAYRICKERLWRYFH